MHSGMLGVVVVSGVLSYSSCRFSRFYLHIWGGWTKEQFVRATFLGVLRRLSVSIVRFSTRKQNGLVEFFHFIGSSAAFFLRVFLRHGEDILERCFQRVFKGGVSFFY